MTTGDFVPFGGDLGNQSTASFVRTGSGTPVDAAPSEIAPVSPAEANDLPGQIHPAPAPGGEPGNEGEAASTAPPVLEYEREGDVVRRVIVNCSCGQSIHLDCDY